MDCNIEGSYLDMIFRIALLLMLMVLALGNGAMAIILRLKGNLYGYLAFCLTTAILITAICKRIMGFLYN